MEETENTQPSVASQVAGAVAGVVIVYGALAVAHNIISHRRQQKAALKAVPTTIAL